MATEVVKPKDPVQTEQQIASGTSEIPATPQVPDQLEESSVITSPPVDPTTDPEGSIMDAVQKIKLDVATSDADIMKELETKHPDWTGSQILDYMDARKLRLVELSRQEAELRGDPSFITDYGTQFAKNFAKEGTLEVAKFGLGFGIGVVSGLPQAAENIYNVAGNTYQSILDAFGESSPEDRFQESKLIRSSVEYTMKQLGLDSKQSLGGHVGEVLGSITAVDRVLIAGFGALVKAPRVAKALTEAERLQKMPVWSWLSTNYPAISKAVPKIVKMMRKDIPRLALADSLGSPIRKDLFRKFYKYMTSSSVKEASDAWSDEGTRDTIMNRLALIGEGYAIGKVLDPLLKWMHKTHIEMPMFGQKTIQKVTWAEAQAMKGKPGNAPVEIAWTSEDAPTLKQLFDYYGPQGIPDEVASKCAPSIFELRQAFGVEGLTDDILKKFNMTPEKAAQQIQEFVDKGIVSGTSVGSEAYPEFISVTKRLGINVSQAAEDVMASYGTKAASQETLLELKAMNEAMERLTGVTFSLETIAASGKLGRAATEATKAADDALTAEITKGLAKIDSAERQLAEQAALRAELEKAISKIPESPETLEAAAKLEVSKAAVETAEETAEQATVEVIKGRKRATAKKLKDASKGALTDKQAETVVEAVDKATLNATRPKKAPPSVETPKTSTKGKGKGKAKVTEETPDDPFAGVLSKELDVQPEFNKIFGTLMQAKETKLSSLPAKALKMIRKLVEDGDIEAAAKAYVDRLKVGRTGQTKKVGDKVLPKVKDLIKQAEEYTHEVAAKTKKVTKVKSATKASRRTAGVDPKILLGLTTSAATGFAFDAFDGEFGDSTELTAGALVGLGAFAVFSSSRARGTIGSILSRLISRTPQGQLLMGSKTTQEAVKNIQGNLGTIGGIMEGLGFTTPAGHISEASQKVVDSAVDSAVKASAQAVEAPITLAIDSLNTPEIANDVFVGKNFKRLMSWINDMAESGAVHSPESFAMAVDSMEEILERQLGASPGLRKIIADNEETILKMFRETVDNLGGSSDVFGTMLNDSLGNLPRIAAKAVTVKGTVDALETKIHELCELSTDPSKVTDAFIEQFELVNNLHGFMRSAFNELDDKVHRFFTPISKDTGLAGAKLQLTQSTYKSLTRDILEYASRLQPTERMKFLDAALKHRDLYDLTGEYLGTLYLASIMSGSLVKNVAINAANMGLNLLDTMAAPVVGAAERFVGRESQASVQESGVMFANFLAGLPQAFKVMKHVLMEGRPPKGLEWAADAGLVGHLMATSDTAINSALHLPLDNLAGRTLAAYNFAAGGSVFRVLSAGDAMFRTMMWNLKAPQFAARRAAKEVQILGLEGTEAGAKEYSKRVAGYLRSTHPEDYPELIARTKALVQVSPLEGALAGLESARKGSLFGTLLQPVFRAPFNAALESMNYVPVVNLLRKSTRDALRPGAGPSVARDEALSKLVSGTAIIGLGWQLGEAGVFDGLFGDVSWMTSADTGSVPHALKFGARIIGLGMLGIPAILLGLGADLRRVAKAHETTEELSGEKQSKLKLLAQTAAVTAMAIAEQAPTDSLVDTAELIDSLDPSKYKSATEAADAILSKTGNFFADKIAQMLVPYHSLAKQFQQARTGVVRTKPRGKRASMIRAFVDTASEALPWLVDDLAPATDAVGNPLTSDRNIFMPHTLLGSVRVTRDKTKDHIVLHEIAKFNKRTGPIKQAMWEIKTPERINGQTLTSKQYRVYDKAFTSFLRDNEDVQSVLLSEEYMELPADRQERVFDNILTRARKYADFKLIEKFPELMNVTESPNNIFFTPKNEGGQ